MKNILVAVLTLSLAAAAAASPQKPTAAEMKKAREHFTKGHAFHQAGNYDDAAHEYEEAFKLAELPDLLYNLGQVHRLRGDKAAALSYYQRYLELAPDGRGAGNAREFASALAVDLAQESALARSLGEDCLRAAAEGAARSLPLPTPPPIVVVPRRAPSSDGGPADESAGRGLRIAGLATGGAGLVALAGAAFFAARASSLDSDQDGATTYDPGLVDDGKAANRNAIICAAVGGAALATGGVLYYLGWRRGREVQVVALPTRGGVTVSATLPLSW